MKKIFLFSIFVLFCSVGFTAQPGFDSDIQRVQTYSPKTTMIGGEMQMLVDYGERGDGQPVYVGNAVQGVATSAQNWVIYNYSYDDSDNFISRKTAFGDWDDRATLSYS